METVKLDTKSADVKLLTTFEDGAKITFSITSAPPAPEVAVNHDGSVTFWAAPGVRTSAIMNNGLYVTFIREAGGTQAISIRLPRGGESNLDTSHGKISLKGSDYFIQMTGGNLTGDKGELILHLVDQVAIFTLTRHDAGAMSMQSLEPTALSTPSPMVVTPMGARPPEWSIAVFDDAAMLRPRPIRLGVPVISTVPVNGVSLSSNDIELLNFGIGLPTRTMYFMALSSIPIPTSITPTLLIYMPAGLDTLSSPVQVPMALLNTPATDDRRSAYAASYVFNVEDTVKYVDGFCYFSIHVPAVVNGFLPFEFQVTSTGSPYSQNSYDDPTLY